MFLQMNHCSIIICRGSLWCQQTTHLSLEMHWQHISTNQFYYYTNVTVLKQTTSAKISICKTDAVAVKLHEQNKPEQSEMQICTLVLLESTLKNSVCCTSYFLQTKTSVLSYLYNLYPLFLSGRCSCKSLLLCKVSVWKCDRAPSAVTRINTRKNLDESAG